MKILDWILGILEDPGHPHQIPLDYFEEEHLKEFGKNLESRLSGTGLDLESLASKLDKQEKVIRINTENQRGGLLQLISDDVSIESIELAERHRRVTISARASGAAAARIHSMFALSSAQVMYAYVMRPETLDPGFWNFIVRAGPIDKETLGAVRAQCSGSPVDLSDLAQYAVPGKDPKAWTTGERLPCVPCAVMHRDTGCALCASHAVAASAADVSAARRESGAWRGRAPRTS